MIPGTPSYSNAIWDCALECALLRRKRKCRNTFDSQVCNQCKFYIKQYINAEPQQAQLFMMQAEIRADSMVRSGGGHHIVFAVALAVVLLFGYASWWVETGGSSKHNGPLPTFVESSSYRPSPSATTVVSKTDYIDGALTRTQRRYAAKEDLNHDGKVNCIDAAIIFYDEYPVKSDVCIELNYNTATGMNHLFNCVKVNGTWKALEPQAYNINARSYWMRDVWKEKYDSSKNEDVTALYLKYIKAKP